MMARKGVFPSSNRERITEEPTINSAQSAPTFYQAKSRVLIALILALSFHVAVTPGHAKGLTDEQVAQNQALARKLLKNLKPGQRSINLGCMDLHVDQLRRLASGEKASFIMDTGIPGVTRYWPNGNVPYMFNPPGIEDGTTDAQGRIAMGRKEVVREAMAEWEAAAQLTFIEIAFTNFIIDGPEQFILVSDHPDRNSSMTGKEPVFLGPQTLNIKSWDNPAFTKWVVVHELGHALGVFHEQTRSDRDNFVDIIEENITEGFDHNFVLKPDSVNFGAYDFDSIMHYYYNAFGIDGETTIEPLPGFEQFKFTMGQRTSLSPSDRAGMAAIYGALLPTVSPEHQPPAGNYNNPIQFTLIILASVDQGNTRYFYTLDGSVPSTDSSEYFDGDIVPISGNTTVKYFALKESRSPSNIVEVEYTFPNGTPMVDTPVISPTGGVYEGNQDITITTTTPGADIHYTFGFSFPT